MRNKIEMYMHCMRCLDECPEGVSPGDWARLNIGKTDNGLQVWCVRHDVNVAAFDFRGPNVVFEGEDESWDDPVECAGCGAVHAAVKSSRRDRVRRAPAAARRAGKAGGKR
jgi:hypothetical protein